MQRHISLLIISFFFTASSVLAQSLTADQKAEIDKLKQEDISLHEIDTVKNYMIGEFVNDSNTVFDFAELYKKLILQSLPEDYYEVFYHKVSNIEPEVIKSMAIETLAVEQFSVIKVY